MPKANTVVQLRHLLSDPSRIIDALLILVPVAIILELAHADPSAIFIVSALGIVPLAGILGEATDALAHRTGPRVGALLNATFGNAAELIITVVAIRAGLIEVVKASITGSILWNILLVMGMSLLLGGLKHGFQRFSRRGASVNVTMMTIAIIGLLIPAIFSQAIEEQSHIAVEYLSIGVAVALMLAYGLNILFSFRMPREDKHDLPGEASTTEHAAWSLRRALSVLAVSVVAIATLSEILVGALEPLIREQGLTELFVGVIIVPIIGNAAEHLVAVEMAMKNKMELALGIALGSSLQIALFVAPLLVFISLIAGHPMSLIFNPFELAALFATVLIAAFIAFDGESNWLEGAQLLIVYVILALAFFFLPA
jgi:Ca2+:H+ antiporter